jgi:ABC-type glutathione transport system ATPase component
MPRAIEADVAVRAVDLSIARDGTRVVDGVSFELPLGGALAVMGPTGSGKSTLAAVIAARGGDAEVVGGSLEVEGIAARRPGRRARVLQWVVGYLAQRAGADLPSRLTVGEVIGQPITSRDRRLNGRALELRIATLLDEMGLQLGAAEKYPFELSAGMRQRVALARALVLDPRLLVADDAYANLDIEVRLAARDAILRRRDAYGMSTVLVTNDIEAARELDADVLVLRGGHAVGYGHSTSEIAWTPDAAAAHRPNTR